MMNEERYKRQTVLPEIGTEGQIKLSNASVLCIGAGGLGSPALLYLAAAGVGHIGIAEFDTVDESNLQRQVLFSSSSIGQPKAQAAKHRLQELNPDIHIELYEDGLHADNVTDLFQFYDVILDGTDNFETKFLINDAAVKYEKPWIYAALQGFEAQVSVFDSTNGPCYRCLYPDTPSQRIANCAEAGIIGAVAGMAGITQAMQVIQIITGDESFEPLIGKLWLLNTKTMQTRSLNIPKNPDCPVCSKPKEDIMFTRKPVQSSLAPELNISDLNGRTCRLIDVREAHEWEAGHLDNAEHWPLSEMAKGNLPDLSGETEIVFYCQKGMRSQQAAQICKDQNCPTIYSLAGGYEAAR